MLRADLVGRTLRPGWDADSGGLVVMGSLEVSVRSFTSFARADLSFFSGSDVFGSALMGAISHGDALLG